VESARRSGLIDVVRGIAIVGVVLIHSGFQSRFDPPTLSVCAFLSVLFDWAVLAFFFLSGLLLDERQTFAVFLKKRTCSLLVPFVFYSLFYNLAFGIIQALTDKHFFGYQWKVSLLWLGWFQSPAFQLYFLPYLFIIAVSLFCLCRLISPRWHGWMLIAGLAGMVALYQTIGWPEQSHGSEWTKLPLYFTAFLFGVVGRTIPRDRPKLPVILLCVIGFGLALVSHHMCLWSLFVPPLLFLAVSKVRSLTNSKLLQAIGRSSGAIYLWHTPILLPTLTTLLALSQVPAMVNFVLSVILTITFCILLRHAADGLFKRFLKIKMPASIIP